MVLLGAHAQREVVRARHRVLAAMRVQGRFPGRWSRYWSAGRGLPDGLTGVFFAAGMVISVILYRRGVPAIDFAASVVHM
jgi:hypothetical protein